MSHKINHSINQLKEHINEEHKKYILEAQSLGRTHALSNLPPLNGGRLVAFMGILRTRYNSLLSYCNQALQPHHQLRLGANQKEANESDQQKASRELEEKQFDHSASRKQIIDSFSSPVLVRFMIGILLIVIITIGDFSYIAKSLQTQGNSRLISIFIALAISTGVTVIGHIALYKISRTTSLVWKWVIFLITFISVEAIFYGLSLMRSAYLHVMSGNAISPLVFMGMNTLFFASVLLVAWYIILPTIPELKQAYQNLWKLQRSKKLAKDIKHIKDSSESKNNATKVFLEERLEIIVEAKALEAFITSMYEEAIEEYKKSNLARRSPGQFPDCFGDSTPTLATYTDNINL